MEAKVLTKEVEAQNQFSFRELEGPNFIKARRDQTRARTAKKLNVVSPIVVCVRFEKFLALKFSTKQKTNFIFQHKKKTGNWKYYSFQTLRILIPIHLR